MNTGELDPTGGRSTTGALSEKLDHSVGEEAAEKENAVIAANN